MERKTAGLPAKYALTKKTVGTASEHGYFLVKIALSGGLRSRMFRVAEDGVALRDDINAVTPRLRRFARALINGSPLPSPEADEIVQATLMRALGARQIGSAADLSIRLFATVTQLHREMTLDNSAAQAVSAGHPPAIASRVSIVSSEMDMTRPTRLSAALRSLSVEDREALLLVALEGFDHMEAARILRISQGALVTRLHQARIALDGALSKRTTPAATRNVPYLRLVT